MRRTRASTCQDLPWLIEQLLQQRCRSSDSVHTLAPEAMAALRAYRWPGNIRELINALDYARALAASTVIGIDDLPDQILDEAASPPAGALGDEAKALRGVLKDHQWNVSATARRLGIDRTTLHRRMRKHGVSLPPRL